MKLDKMDASYELLQIRQRLYKIRNAGWLPNLARVGLAQAIHGINVALDDLLREQERMKGAK